MNSPITYQEAELVGLLKQRNSQAFSYLYSNYSGALYTTILQIVADKEIASDVLQEVFLNIWRRIESYDATKGRLYTWMMQIARNASIDMVRSSAFQNSTKNQSLNDDVYESNSNQSTTINVDNIGLKNIVGQLKDDHRWLIELSYFKGYTHEEIAEIEDIPLGTVKSRIRAALTQLRKILK